MSEPRLIPPRAPPTVKDVRAEAGRLLRDWPGFKGEPRFRAPWVVDGGPVQFWQTGTATRNLASVKAVNPRGNLREERR